MKVLQVDLGQRSYPIYIGTGLLDAGPVWSRHLPGRQVLVVSNETVAPLYLARVTEALSGSRFSVETLTLPDGEQYKTLDTASRILDTLMELRYDRDCTLVALGGGVIGDLTGFAAACYLRGVHFVQMPTTLLAQVDSSVGGKTGVNHPLGKNMIGAFHQPRCVVADIGTLDTLGERDFRAGLAEVIKYGLIANATFLGWLEENLDALLTREPEALAEAVQVSCRTKADIVARDERERGLRALLNFGHTFGHAIETGLGYGTLLHGEAVAVGMLMAAELSRRLGDLDAADCTRIRRLVERAGLPTAAPEKLDAQRFLSLMASDKKVRGGRLRLVLLASPGRAEVRDDFDPGELRALLETFPRAAAYTG
ncbi:MAG TPA: 3-dehydroquinate synthase [Gammaproteobacteria bacterium]|nr:3-dehydroquinate synthase [Gammaproteobacteria bacterium]